MAREPAPPLLGDLFQDVRVAKVVSGPRNDFDVMIRLHRFQYFTIKLQLCAILISGN